MKRSESGQPAHEIEMHWWRWLLIVGGVVAIIALFYGEENWRGKRAWEQYKRELQGQGEKLDWDAYIPAPVPDDQNIFAAPKMTAWFVGRGGNELSGLLSYGRDDFLRQRDTNPVVELTIVSPDSQINPGDADLVLRYQNSVLSSATEDDKQTGSSKARPNPEVYVGSGATKQLAGLIRKVFASRTNGLQQPTANAVQAFTVFVKSVAPTKPGHVIVQADKMPNLEEVEDFFPRKVLSYIGFGQPSSRAHAEPAGTNSFRVWVGPLPYTAAEDYLAWSDQFEPEFDVLREALKRPYARMNGDYSQPTSIPIPNFVTVRMLVQTLAQRAQCYLLLAQSQAALRQLSLIHGSCRLLECQPTGKPTTLVAAMIHVAVTGLYVSVIGDGLRMNAWREPELESLQAQLQEISLLPHVASAFEAERASLSRVLETVTPSEYDQLFNGSGSTTLWDRLQDPRYAFMTLAPAGWLYQNMKTLAQRKQAAINAFDHSRNLILPGKVDRLIPENSMRVRLSANNFLADLAPNFNRAIQTTARNQTLVNEALVACALERYRLANGRYSETLGALTPRFLEKIPADIIGGKPLNFQLRPDGQYVLYSIGWNEKDDGGIPGSKDPFKFELEKGDWVWPYQ
jgi:hypothetical protein